MQRSVAEGATAAAGTRKQGIEPAVRVDTLGERVLRRFLVGQVGGDPRHGWPDLFSQRHAVLFAQRDHEQSRPFGGESFGGGLGNSRRPRDAAHLASEPTVDV